LGSSPSTRCSRLLTWYSKRSDSETVIGVYEREQPPRGLVEPFEVEPRPDAAPRVDRVVTRQEPGMEQEGLVLGRPIVGDPTRSFEHVFGWARS
jgi:hypothetical protein